MVIHAYIIHEAHASGRFWDRAGNVIVEDLSSSHGVSIFLPATASSFYKAENYDFAAEAIRDGAEPAVLQAADASGADFS